VEAFDEQTMPIVPMVLAPRKYAEPPAIPDYDVARTAFDWQAVAEELRLDPAAMNVGELAAQRPIDLGLGDDHALIWYGQEGVEERYSYSEFAQATAKAARVYQDLGVQRGDRVVILLPHVPQLYFAVVGALRAGAVVAVLGGGRNIDYLRNILNRSKPRVMVTVPAFKASVTSLRPEVKELRTILFLNRVNAPAPPIEEGEALWNHSFEAAPADFTKAPTNSADRAYIHYTDLGMAGSVVTHLSALSLYTSGRDALEMRPKEGVMCVAMPGEHTFFSYGLLAPFIAGAKAIALEDPAHFGRYGDLAAAEEPKVWYSGQKAIDVILRTDPNLGTLLKGCRNICVNYPYDPSFVVMTSDSYGSPLHAVWWEREFGVIQSCELRACNLKPGSVGRALPGSELRVVDDTGAPMPEGTPGFLAVKLGPGAPFLEYWGDPGLTQTHVRDGWFVTTRTARVDAEGYIWVET
jgi:acetyl-CoA synthetase